MGLAEPERVGFQEKTVRVAASSTRRAAELDLFERYPRSVNVPYPSVTGQPFAEATSRLHRPPPGTCTKSRGVRGLALPLITQLFTEPPTGSPYIYSTDHQNVLLNEKTEYFLNILTCQPLSLGLFPR